jgi:hypothetical protein
VINDTRGRVKTHTHIHTHKHTLTNARERYTGHWARTGVRTVRRQRLLQVHLLLRATLSVNLPQRTDVPPPPPGRRRRCTTTIHAHRPNRVLMCVCACVRVLVCVCVCVCACVCACAFFSSSTFFFLFYLFFSPLLSVCRGERIGPAP